jgi:hypothetical protein
MAFDVLRACVCVCVCVYVEGDIVLRSVGLYTKELKVNVLNHLSV